MTLQPRNKTVIIFVVVLASSLGLNSFINIVSFRGEYKQALYEKVIETGGQIENNLREVLNLGLNIRQLEGMNEICVNVLKSHPDLGYVFVVDTQGNIIYHSVPESIGGTSRDTVGLFALQARDVIVQQYKKEGVGYFDVSLPVFDREAGRAVTIRLGLLEETVNRKVKDMAAKSLLLSLSVFIVAVFLVTRFTGRI
ncbi:MAG: hypothetical protein ABH858_02050 [Candidatus Omnitrophota bacterium]